MMISRIMIPIDHRSQNPLELEMSFKSKNPMEEYGAWISTSLVCFDLIWQCADKSVNIAKQKSSEKNVLDGWMVLKDRFAF